MSGCPYIKWDNEKHCEVCKVTGKPTGVSLVCDFDYETDCETYSDQTKKDE